MHAWFRRTSLSYSSGTAEGLSPIVELVAALCTLAILAVGGAAGAIVAELGVNAALGSGDEGRATIEIKQMFLALQNLPPLGG